MAGVNVETVRSALATVRDPEIGRPITELGMVRSIEVSASGVVDVGVLLTVAGCPMREEITRRVTAAVAPLEGVREVRVDLGVMSEAQRKELAGALRGGTGGEREVPFARPGSLTRVYAVASGKGGVGKSSVTANLAVALAQRGLAVGVLDADMYGFSIPRMLGVTAPPTMVEGMIMPPVAHDVRVISTGMFSQDKVVVWRGPLLHRALTQFLTDVFWGDLDVLLLDLPPGTGDIPISVAQLVPSAEIIVVTTPQLAAHEVAERAGLMAMHTRQQILGVVENMGPLPCPHCGEPIELFGAGGGAAVAERLSQATGHRVELLASIPFSPALRAGGDLGSPIVLSDPEAPAAQALRALAEALASRARGLAGRSLSLTPVATR